MTSGLLAEFREVRELTQAVDHLRSLGYGRLEAFTPYPVPGMAMPVTAPLMRLGAVVLGASLASAALAYGVQWWTGMDFPLLVASMPAHPWPAYIPITFESAILGGVLGALIAGAYSTGLPRLWDEVFLVDGFERATIDRYFLLIDARDPLFNAMASRHALAGFTPLRLVMVGAGDDE